MKTPPSKSWPAGVFWALLGLFFLFLAVGTSTGGYDGNRFEAWSIHGFMLLLMGGMTLLFFTLAYQEFFGEKKSVTEVEKLFLTFCPACGEGTKPADLWCSHCRFPLAKRAESWKPEDGTGGMLAFSLSFGFGGALFLLGIFLGVGPFLEKGFQLWAALGMAALGLLVGGVGGFFLLAGVWLLWNELRGIRRWVFSWTGSEARLNFTVKGKATTRWNDLVYLHGTLATATSMEVPAGDPEVLPWTPAQKIFADLMSRFYLGGLVGLWHDRRSLWIAGKEKPLGKEALQGKIEPRREIVKDDLMCRFFLDQKRHEQLSDSFQPFVTEFSSALLEEMKVAEFCKAVETREGSLLFLQRCRNQLPEPDAELADQSLLMKYALLCHASPLTAVSTESESQNG